MIKVAVGIITLGSQILVCQRKKSSRYPLKWEFPGGKFEEGESAEQCLRRELREELSIDANVGAEFFRQQWDYPDSGSFEVYYHLVPSFSGTLRNNIFEQVRWIHSTDLQTIDMLDGNKEVVDKIKSQNGKFPNGTTPR